MNERTLSVSDPRETIRRRAYELFLARGREPGRALEDWIAAEAELAAAVPVKVEPPAVAEAPRPSTTSVKSSKKLKSTRAR